MTIKEKNKEENKEVNPEVKELQDKLAELTTELADTRKEAAQRRVALKDFEGIDIEEYKDLKASQESLKQKELESAGNFEEAKKAIVESYESKLNESSSAYKELEKKYKKLAITDSIVSSAAKLNAIDPKSIAILLREEITLGEKGDIQVLDPEGKPVFNEKGNQLTVNERVENFLKENQYLVKGSTSGTGSAGGEHKAPNSENKSSLDKIISGLKG